MIISKSIEINISEMSTNLKDIDTDEYITVQKDGIFIFGPYLTLEEGDYEITISGSFLGRFYAELTSLQAAVIHATCENKNDDHIFIKYRSRRRLDDVEIRIGGKAGGKIKINNIKVDIKNIKKQNRFDIYERLNLSLMLDDLSLVDKSIISTGWWEKPQLVKLSQLVNQIDGNNLVFLDIGAYFGLYSLFLMQLEKFKKIYAFESDVVTYKQLLSNLLLNDIDCKISPFNIAISDHKGKINVFRSTDHPSNNRGGVGVTKEGGDEIECDSIDNIMTLSNELLCVKIDVEGHEIQVINGMRETLTRNKCLLQIEIFGDRSKHSDILESFGYKLIGVIHVDHYYTNTDIKW